MYKPVDTLFWRYIKSRSGHQRSQKDLPQNFPERVAYATCDLLAQHPILRVPNRELTRSDHELIAKGIARRAEIALSHPSRRPPAAVARMTAQTGMLFLYEQPGFQSAFFHRMTKRKRDEIAGQLERLILGLRPQDP